MQYFLKHKFDDIGWAEFGQDVETSILTQDFSKFSQPECDTLKKVKALDLSQYKIEIDFGWFKLIGYIDTISKDFSLLKDFKTASIKSKEKYYKDEYEQAYIYAIGIKEQVGFYPKIEIEIIERLGNAYKGGRPALSVGTEVWVVDKEMTKEIEEKLRDKIVKVAEEISNYYQTFLKLNNH